MPDHLLIDQYDLLVNIVSAVDCTPNPFQDVERLFTERGSHAAIVLGRSGHATDLYTSSHFRTKQVPDFPYKARRDEARKYHDRLHGCCNVRLEGWLETLLVKQAEGRCIKIKGDLAY